MPGATGDRCHFMMQHTSTENKSGAAPFLGRGHCATVPEIK